MKITCFNKSVFILVACMILMLPALAASDFIIQDIRVEGLQRLTPGTVFNYLSVKAGDEFNDRRSGEAIRILFKTGLFDDVRLERDGNILVVIVKERPSIHTITLSGNEEIDTDELVEGLRQAGFSEGRIFDISQLDALEKGLRQQYFSLGKYAVKIDSTITELDDNRVDISIKISEGVPARIKSINIVGNEVFKEDDLLDKFKSSTSTLFSFFTNVDQYSKQKLSSDLETLHSYYLDHGYINFDIDSTQVSISPDKKDIYVTINITEGDQFTISKVQIAGDLIVPEEVLFEQVKINRGDLFSRKKVAETSKNISDVLGDEGYGFANVNVIPEIDKENKTVAMTFFVDPGKRVYVRRINFSGNIKTRDEVLRREMRQQEASWISTSKVQRGRVRLQRLGYFTEVNVETPVVPGKPDQVDVNYSVVEKPSGQFLAGLGFSQGQGLIFQTSISQDNFLGSGKSVAFAFNTSKVNRQFSLGYNNPYYTVDGIRRGFNVTYRKRDAGNANVTRFDSTAWGGGVNFGIPVTEFNNLFVSLDYENTKIFTNNISAVEIRDFIEQNGDRFDILRLSGSFVYDTRNHAIFSDDGMLHRLAAQLALPGLSNSLEFFKLSYRTQWFFEIVENYVLSLRGDISYGDTYNDADLYPFFENFYAGGPKSVRGYEENTLGPRDSANRPLGGNLRLLTGVEMILPVPFLDDLKSVRLSGFFDAGNVYDTSSDQGFDIGELRYSAGIAGIWVSPFGILSISVAMPIADQGGDQTQPFQFTFGVNF